MEIKKITDSIIKGARSSADAAKKKLTDFFTAGITPKKTVVVLAAAGILLIVLIISLGKHSAVKKITYTPLSPLENDQDLIIPKNPDLDEKYEFTRNAKSFWDNSDADQWFKAPDENDIKDLEKSNDKIISTITGAAP